MGNRDLLETLQSSPELNILPQSIVAADGAEFVFLVADDGSRLRPLARDPDHVHRVGGVTRDGEQIAYASNARNDVDFDVYVAPRLTSASELFGSFDKIVV